MKKSKYTNFGLNIFYSGKDTAPGRYGVTKDGAKYYEVKLKGARIEGCYEKINFHSLHSQAKGYKYPIFKQTGGSFYLRINENKERAPWIFADEQENIKYM